MPPKRKANDRAGQRLSGLGAGRTKSPPQVVQSPHLHHSPSRPQVCEPPDPMGPIVETPSTQMSRAGWTLRVLLLACDSGAALRDHKSSGRVHRRCATGVELVDWLLVVSSSVHSRQQAVGMWQALVEEGVLTHGQYHPSDISKQREGG
uniref:DEP domain-containing protein n=1 Tax=Timema tahoe TaxID=61484 RepID=A0A7R9FGJ0_9NEOP|nr:unnamed protein product [Timema tahoe]